jgi:hypothetical protein
LSRLIGIRPWAESWRLVLPIEEARALRTPGDDAYSMSTIRATRLEGDAEDRS